MCTVIFLLRNSFFAPTLRRHLISFQKLTNTTDPPQWMKDPTAAAMDCCQSWGVVSTTHLLSRGCSPLSQSRSCSGLAHSPLGSDVCSPSQSTKGDESFRSHCKQTQRDTIQSIKLDVKFIICMLARAVSFSRSLSGGCKRIGKLISLREGRQLAG